MKTESVEREPTKAQITQFRRAAAILKKLGLEGCTLYLANDMMHLMSGPSHDGRDATPRQDRVRDSRWIPGASSGDW